MSKQRKPGWWLSRLGFLALSPFIAGPVALTLLLLAGLLAYRQAQLSGIPDTGVPFDPDGVVAMQVDPAENAAADYEAAFSMLNSVAEPDYEVLDAVLSGRWDDRPPTIDR